MGRGRKSWLPEGTVTEVVRVTLEELPDDDSTHWTTRTMAERFDMDKETVARIWKNDNLKPWKIDTFKISTDPDFEEKLVDVVGRYEPAWVSRRLLTLETRMEHEQEAHIEAVSA